MTEAKYIIVFCCVLYSCFIIIPCKAFPSPTEVQEDKRESTSTTDRPTAIMEPRNSVGQGRQAAILATLGTALAPFVLGLFSPFISQLAGMISSTVLGKLQGGPVVNSSALFNYDAYMINMPNQPGPYLYLTTPPKDATKSESARPTLPYGKKTAKISQRLGTVNIKPNLQELTEGGRKMSRDMKELSDTTESLEIENS